MELASNKGLVRKREFDREDRKDTIQLVQPPASTGSKMIGEAGWTKKTVVFDGRIR